VIKKLLHHHVSLGVLEDDSDITSRLIRLAVCAKDKLLV